MFVLPQFTKIGSSIKGDLISHFSSASTKHYLNVTISKLVECHLTFGHYYLFSGGDPLYPPRWPEDVMLSNIETQIFSFTPSIRRFCAAKYYVVVLLMNYSLYHSLRFTILKPRSLPKQQNGLAQEMVDSSLHHRAII